MKYFVKNNGEPMTNEERLEQFPDGRCALCFSTSIPPEEEKWTTVFFPDEELYVAQCNSCGTQYPVAEEETEPN